MDIIPDEIFIITDEILQNAAALTDAAPDIIFAAEVALLARGVTDEGEVMPALLAAAWARYKDMAGPDRPGPFARLLRRWADHVEASERPN